MKFRILIFLSVFLSIYGGINFYAFNKIYKLLNLSSLHKNILLFIFILMTISFPIIRSLEQSIQSNVLKSLILSSFIWMGFIFYVFFLFISTDIFLCINKFTFNSDYIRTILLNQKVPIIIILTSLSICLYAYFEALNIQVTIINIPNHKISKELKIVQISDVHLGVLVGHKRLKKISDIVLSLNPDLLVITGDLFDEDVNHLNELHLLLKKIKPPLGKYAVTGNHEFYAGLDKALEFAQKSDIKFLRNKTETILHTINIIGIDDHTAKNLHQEINTSDLNILTENLDKNLFTVLLKHEPTNFYEAESKGVDLQLSGHTHNGQIFPFNIFVHFFFNPQTGLHKTNQSFLYISRGTGTWGPPMRFLSPPEITLFIVRP